MAARAGWSPASDVSPRCGALFLASLDLAGVFGRRLDHRDLDVGAMVAALGEQVEFRARHFLGFVEIARLNGGRINAPRARHQLQCALAGYLQRPGAAGAVLDFGFDVLTSAQSSRKRQSQLQNSGGALNSLLE